MTNEEKRARPQSDPGPPPRKSCAGTKRNGEPCKRLAPSREEYCWQHAQGLWRKIRALPRRQVFVGVCLPVVLFIAGVLIQLWLPKPTTLEQVTSRQGEPLQKAPQSEFDREVNRSADNLKRTATEYFDAAEDDAKGQDYKGASENYAKSIAAIPTMAAYLNQGLSYLNLSDRPRAEAAFQNGIQMSRDEQNKAFEVAFLDCLGSVYLHEGQPSAALDTLQQALTVGRQPGLHTGKSSRSPISASFMRDRESTMTRSLTSKMP